MREARKEGYCIGASKRAQLLRLSTGAPTCIDVTMAAEADESDIFLVQESDTAIRRKLFVDASGMRLTDLNRVPLDGRAFAWTQIKRWQAEQKNVFVVLARTRKANGGGSPTGSGFTEHRLLCDDASAIQEACNRAVKAALAKQRERQRAKKLPTVFEEERANAVAASAANSDGTATTPREHMHADANPLAAAMRQPPSPSLSSALVESPQAPEDPAPRAQERRRVASELWSGWLRSGGRFSFGVMSQKKRWYAFNTNGRLKSFHGEPGRCVSATPAHPHRPRALLPHRPIHPPPNAPQTRPKMPPCTHTIDPH